MKRGLGLAAGGRAPLSHGAWESSCQKTSIPLDSSAHFSIYIPAVRLIKTLVTSLHSLGTSLLITTTRYFQPVRALRSWECLLFVLLCRLMHTLRQCQLELLKGILFHHLSFRYFQATPLVMSCLFITRDCLRTIQWEQKTNILKRQGRYDEALSLLTRARKLRPCDKVIVSSLASVLFDVSVKLIKEGNKEQGMKIQRHKLLR